MSKPADRRILGLSPRARRVAVPFLVFAAVLVVVVQFSSRRSGESSRADAVVGADRHAAGDRGSLIFDNGQAGAGHRPDTAGREQHRPLDGKDAQGDAGGSSPIGLQTQAVGHARGLRR